MNAESPRADVELSEAEREALQDVWRRLSPCGVFLADVAPAVERIIADRLAAVMADECASRPGCDRLATDAESLLARAESAEAERVELRARLLAVETLEQALRTFALVRSTSSDPYDRPLLDDYGKGIVRACDDLRAVLASPSTHTQRDTLAVCDQDHGHDDNPARVYGHHGSQRTCIRIKATDQWVYDPAWEKTNG